MKDEPTSKTRRQMLEQTLGELILEASARGAQALFHPMAWDGEKPSALVAIAFGDAAEDLMDACTALSNKRKNEQGPDSVGVPE